MKKILLIVLLTAYIDSINAQQGPVNPCVNCEESTMSTQPYNGIWYNPQQPGTGFSIEIQNNKVFGAYYGYDETGKQIWLTFLGDLIESDEAGVMWKFESALKQFENGTSFNTPHQDNIQTDYQGTINISFTHKNHAQFSVNNGDVQNIVPIIFGVSKSIDFPEYTTYEFPELTGLWTFVVQQKGDLEQYTTFSEVLFISDKTLIDFDSDGDLDLKYNVVRYFGELPGALFVGRIICELNTVNNEINPSCRFKDNRFPFTDVDFPQQYQMSLGGLGAMRLFGQDQNGLTFEAIRINFDDYP